MASFSYGAIDEALLNTLLQGQQLVEERLRQSVETSNAMATWTGKYLLEAGGKRVRPALVFLSAAFGDVNAPQVVSGATLVELTHLATLYHDDVMDSSATRRGIKTAHEVWGNKVAILSGDFLFARASAMSAELGPDIVKLHAHTFERLCLGQLNETVGPSENEDPFAHHLSVLSNKTGSLISTAGIIGATLGGASPEVIDTMAKYGEAVGIAFQLADDVIDLRSDPKESGKRRGTDLREGIPTMPTLLLKKAAELADADELTLKTFEAIKADLSDDDALDRAVKLLAEHDVVEQTQELANEFADRALELVASLPEGKVRNALEIFTHQLVRRNV